MFTLTVNARDSYPPYLTKAIEIANVILQYPPIAYDFSSILGANSVTAKHLQDVEIRFQKLETSIYGWTHRSKNAKEIFVNEVLRDRLININQDAQYCKIDPNVWIPSPLCGITP